MFKTVSNPRSLGSNWFVVQTNPTCELLAKRSLSRAGFGVYLPQRKTETQQRRTKKWVTISHSLMTGYIFVQLPAGDHDWFKLRGCDGVKAVLGAANFHGELEPFPVSSRIIEQVMSAQLNMLFDDTREAKARRDAMAAELYSPGAQVTAIAGPFATLSAEVVRVTGHGMVEALVSLFGRLSVVSFPAHQLEQIAA